MKPQALRTSLAAVVATLVGCAGPRFDAAQSLERLKGIDTRAASQRRVVDLDVSGNGRIDAPDWAALESVAQAATTELQARGETLDVLQGLYLGPAAEGAPTFAALSLGGASFDVKSLESAQLRELAIEARWLAQQARIAAVAGGVADDRLIGGLMQSMVKGYDAETMEPAALCAAINSLDVTPLTAAGVTPAAIFDLDSTVWAGNVMDPYLAVLVADALPAEDANPKLREFLKTVPGVDAATVDGNNVVKNAALLLDRSSNPSLPKEQRVNAKDAFYNIVSLMHGMTPAQAHAAAAKSFTEGAPPFAAWGGRMFIDSDGCGMRKVIADLENNGVRVYLLSATLDVLAWAGGDVLGVPRERVLGSLLEVKDGKYTGEVAHSTYYAKGAISRQWLPSPHLFAFGDSPSSDFSMLLESIGASFMINPRQSLLDKDAAEAGSRFVGVTFDGTEAEPAAAP